MIDKFQHKFQNMTIARFKLGGNIQVKAVATNKVQETQYHICQKCQQKIARAIILNMI